MLRLPLRNTSKHLDRLQKLRNSQSIDTIISSIRFTDIDLEPSDYELLRQQSVDLASPGRFLDTVLLESVTSESSNISLGVQVLTSCFNAGRFSDVIRHQDFLAPSHGFALQLRLASASRLGDWQQVNKLSNWWQVDELPFVVLCMIIRANLEMGFFEQCAPLFAALKPVTPHQQHQADLLILLRFFMEGTASDQHAYRLLKFFPSLTASEIACFVRFLPQVSALTGESSKSQRIIRSAWKRLGKSKIIASVSKTLTPLQCNSNGMRVALVLSEDSDELCNLAKQLKEAFRLINSDYELVSVYLKVKDLSLLRNQGEISCSLLAPAERLEMLRDQRFDILLDTVGPQDPSWLLTVAQYVAPLQLAWFSSTFPIPASSPYHAQVADRWTVPDQPQPHDAAWLALTGVRQLAQPSQLQPTEFSSESHKALVVLGQPSTMLPGAASMLKDCLDNPNVSTLYFCHQHWSNPGFLAHWWKHWLGEDLPTECKTLGLDSISGYSLIGLDLNLISPSKEAILMLGRGFPVIALPAVASSSRGILGILSSLGLSSLAPSDPNVWLETVYTLLEDPSAYDKISAHVRDSFSESLVCDPSPLVRDLIESMPMIQSAAQIDLC